jgi:hypothetical protein
MRSAWGTHNARLYHRVQDYLLHLIYVFFADVATYLLKKEGEKTRLKVLFRL